MPANNLVKVGSTVNIRERERIKEELEKQFQTDPRAAILKALELLGAEEARFFLDKLEAKYRERVQELEAQQDELKTQLDELKAPPLRSGVYLKPSPDNPEKVAIIGLGGTRMEMVLVGKPPADPEDLPGYEVWINGENQVVKFRETYIQGEAAEVLERLDATRLRVKGQGNEELVIEILPGLVPQPLDVGDTVRISSNLGVAFEKLREREKTILEPERIPDVTYDQIGGLDAQITEIREAIEYPYLYRGLFQRYDLKRPKGILLFGPPGCGKTLVAKAIAHSLSEEIRARLSLTARALEIYLAEASGPDVRVQQYIQWRSELRRADQASLPEGQHSTWEMCRAALHNYLGEQKVDLERSQYELKRLRKAETEEARGYFLTISGPEILNKFVGETESSIRRIFVLARKKATRDTPVVIFFDELESMFSRRGSHISSDVESTIVPQLLSEIDGMDELSDVIIIGASNRYDLIDPAVLRPGRLDLKIEVGRPGPQAAKDIFAKYLKPQLPISETTLNDYGGDAQRAVSDLIARITAVLYSPDSYLLIYEKAGRNETMARYRRLPLQRRKPLSETVSGAMFASIVARAKQSAVRREVNGGSKGLRWDPDFLEAIESECSESKEQYISEIRETRDVIDAEAFGVEVHLAAQPVDAGSSDRGATRWFGGKRRPWIVTPVASAAS